MFEERRDKWHWILRKSGILDPWFDDYQQLAATNAVKKNPVRTVFRFNDYFIKLDTPEKLFHRLRNCLRPKAKIEFETALKLEKCSVPVVEHLGWGHCGSISMLITRAFPNAVSVMDYWMNQCVYGDTNPDEFLGHYGNFLRQIFDSGCYHPDFHNGNILYNPENNKFALVDLYGINTSPGQLSDQQRLKMLGIITCLRAVLSDTEAIAFINNSQIKFKNTPSDVLWQQLLELELSRIRQRWPKRKKQIIAEYDKFITRRDDDEGKYLFRNKQNRIPYIMAELPLNTTAPKLYAVDLPAGDAEKIWIEAFLKNFLGENQNMPLVWYKPHNSDKTTLYFAEPVKS